MYTREEIEKDARLSAICGGESDCYFIPGTPGHAIWMAAYFEEGAREAENAQISYEMALEDGRA